jgi:RHS repeat-associated protein
MVLGMVSAVACGHGQPGQGQDEGEKEHVGAQAQAVVAALAWPPTPVVPAGKVGTLPGGGGVGPTGAYSYVLPIDVPPGRAGMTPSLSLSYSSTAGNGLLGVGWGLGGAVSAITPCNKTIAVDGFAEARSALCMDGARLVDIGNGEWRTESDRFARITSLGTVAGIGSLGYKVELKDGRILRYAKNLTGYGLSAAPNYLLSSEADRDGNKIVYDYEVTGDGGSNLPWEVYPKSIVYGQVDEAFFDDTSLEASHTGSRRIVFGYETTRPDPIYSDVLEGNGILGDPGFLSTSTAIKRRLHSISCYAPGPKDSRNPSNDLAWAYTLSYLPSATSGRSTLTSVKRTGALGGESFARTFAWQSSKGGTYTVANTIGPFDDPNQAVMAVDVDNNGKDELLIASTSSLVASTPTLFSTGANGTILGVTKALTGLSGATFKDARVADMSGDGVPEILAPDRFADGQGTKAYRLYQWSDALQDYSQANPAQKIWDDYVGPFSLGAEQPIFLGDLDADGLPDLVQARHVAPVDPSCTLFGTPERPKCLAHEWYYAHNTGNGTFSPTFVQATTAFLGSSVAYGSYFAPLTGSPFASLSTSNPAGRVNLIAAALFAPGISGDAYMMSLAPGDPAPQVRSVKLPTASALCALADFRGRGAYQQECFDPASVGSPLLTAKDWRISVYDVDADGRSDLLAYNFGTDVNGHFRVIGLSFRVYYDVAGVRHQDPITQIPLVGGDFDGDGIEDAYLYDRATDTTYVGLQTGPTRDLMTAVAEENNGSIPDEIVTYSQRWSPDPLPPPACVHPQRCIRRGMNVVVEHDVYQGADINRYQHHIYSYDDPRADVHGRGFLGFATVREWNPDRPAETITTYDNASSLAGVYQSSFPTVVRSYVPVDPTPGKRGGTDSLQVRVSETTSVYQHNFLNQGKTNFTNRASWTSVEWETPATLDWTPGISKHFAALPGWTALRTRNGGSWVDAYGNETHRWDSTVGGVATAVDMDYEYRPVDWLIALVSNKRTSVQDPSSGASPQPRRADYTYDALGHLTQIKIEKFSTLVAPELFQSTEFEYLNSHGLVTKITASLVGGSSRSTTIEYDPEEGIFPRATWNDLKQVSLSLYHPTYGTVSDYIDPNGVETQMTVDDFGRVRETKHGNDAPAAIAYSPRMSGNWVVGTYVVTSGDGQVPVTTSFDSLGRVVREEHTGFDYRTVAQQNIYDVLGRLIFSSRPGVTSPALAGTSYTYDSMDRLRTVVAPDLSTVTQTPTFWKTDTVGPVPAGPSVPGYVAHHGYVERDVDGRVIVSAQVSAQNTILKTKFAYGDFNQVRTITDPQANVTTISYDQRGRRTQLVDPDTGTSVLHYNGFGEVMSTDLPSVDGSPGPSTTTYARDVLGRVTGVASPDGKSNFTWDTATNGAGMLASRVGPDGTTESFSYDSFGRVQQRAWSVHGPVIDESFDILIDYDSSSRPKTVTYPSVKGRATRFKTQLDYRADTLANQSAQANQKGGYLQQVTEVDLPVPLRLWSVGARNVDDRLLTGITGNKVTEQRVYNSVTGRLSTILDMSNVSSTPVLSLDYTYWPDGAVKSRSDLARGRNETFDYGDGLSRLTAWHLAYGGVTRDVGYHFDPIGNLDQVTVGGAPSETNTPDPTRPHALGTTTILPGGSVLGFKYDARGRQFSAAYNNRSVTFNELNLPKTITTDAGTTTFDYDAVGGRVKKTDPNGVETVTLGGLYERRKAEKSTVHIFYVPGSDGNLTQVSYSDDGTTQKEWHEYVHSDALGSAVAVTDDNSAVTRFDSEPFGKRIQPNGAAYAGLLPNVQVGFTGHHMDDDLGLVNMKGRIYDPSQRRFISPDPLVARPMNAQGYNRYSYVYNNPLNLTDPSGFCGETPEDPCVPPGGGGTYCDLHPEDPNCRVPEPGGDNGQTKGAYTEQQCNGNTTLPGCYPASDKGGSGAPSKPVHQVVFVLPPLPPPPAQFHAVPVPVFDNVVNSDALGPKQPIYRDGGMFGEVSASPPPPFLLARQIVAVARILDPQFDGALKFVEGIHATVVEPVIDWAADMHTASPGRMRDHSEAMAGAMGAVVLAVIMPGEAAAVEAVPAFEEGAFSIIDWSGYPAGMARPAGPFRVISGAEYDAAREAATTANRQIIKEFSAQGSGYHIHELQPVKFGGSPTDMANKVFMPWQEHIGVGGVHPEFWDPLLDWTLGK